MAALTAGMNRPGATADLGPGGPLRCPDHRTSRRGPVRRGLLRHQDRPVLAAAGPGRPGRGRGVVRVGRHRAEDRVRAGLPAAGHPAVAAPGHVHHPARRRRGVRRVRAARLAGRRALDQRPDPPVRQVVRDLLLRARHGRAGGLPPAGPGRGGAGTVARHHDRVLPAGPGPGHGDHAGPHAARRCWHRSGRTGQWDRRTSSIAVPSLVRRGPGRGGPGPGRTPGASGRVRSFRRDQDGPAAGPQRRGGNSSPVRHRPGTRGRQQACSSGKAGIQTCPAQRGNQGLQPGPERPGAHDQRRAGGHSSCPGQTRQRRGCEPDPAQARPSVQLAAPAGGIVQPGATGRTRPAAGRHPRGYGRLHQRPKAWMGLAHGGRTE